MYNIRIYNTHIYMYLHTCALLASGGESDHIDRHQNNVWQTQATCIRVSHGLQGPLATSHHRKCCSVGAIELDADGGTTAGTGTITGKAILCQSFCEFFGGERLGNDGAKTHSDVAGYLDRRTVTCARRSVQATQDWNQTHIYMISI